MSSAFDSVNLHFGSLVVAALIALVGSSTAESLTLGNHGAAGLIWATMSMFGAISIVRACVAATMPGWVRESLGLRNDATDAAVGQCLELQTDLKSRNRLGAAIGVVQIVPSKNLNHSKRTTSEEKTAKGNSRDVYALDQCTLGHLSVLPYTKAADPLRIYLFTPDPYHKDRLAQNDMLGLLGSVVKLAEVGVLWRCHAYTLCWITGLHWAFVLLCALSIMLFRASHNSHGDDDGGGWDILTGQLPTPIKPGGQRKLLLGAPRNVRHDLIWMLVWGLEGLVCMVSVIASYLSLQRQDTLTFYIWSGLQLLLFTFRSAFFHFSNGMDSICCYPVPISKGWKDLSQTYRVRICRLVFALSDYQIHIHPRGSYCYTEDLHSVSQLDELQYEFPLGPMKEGEVVEIYVNGVIGDTVLSSAAWTYGADLSGMDLYDSCIVKLKIKGANISIPSARVLTDTRPRHFVDVEVEKDVLRPPRGYSNTGRFIAWWYWIPCGKKRWLQLRTDNMSILGERQATVVSDEQVTAVLQSGELFVSITEVEDVREIVRHSTEGCKVLCEMLRWS